MNKRDASRHTSKNKETKKKNKKNRTPLPLSLLLFFFLACGVHVPLTSDDEHVKLFPGPQCPELFLPRTRGAGGVGPRLRRQRRLGHAELHCAPRSCYSHAHRGGGRGACSQQQAARGGVHGLCQHTNANTTPSVKVNEVRGSRPGSGRSPSLRTRL